MNTEKHMTYKLETNLFLQPNARIKTGYFCLSDIFTDAHLTSGAIAFASLHLSSNIDDFKWDLFIISSMSIIR